MKKIIGNEINLNYDNYKKAVVQKINGIQKYGVFILVWDVEKNIAKGWFTAFTSNSLKECSEYIRNF